MEGSSPKTKVIVAGGLSLVLLGGAAWWYWRGRERKKRKSMGQRVVDSFRLTNHQLKEIVSNIRFHMEQGLANNQTSNLKMLPSFVPMPTGQEKGLFAALDLGGTNFRVLALELKGNRVIGESQKQQFVIPKDVMQGTADHLFDFIAECLKEFSNKLSVQEIPLGFTFSFPVQQTAIDAGTLIHWTKGFSTSGVEGEDVVELLSAALKRKGVDIKVVALINDTVGTMATRAYVDNRCKAGLILGTGTNACYIERRENIIKVKEPFTHDIIINMEWGGFSFNLPLTSYDRLVDQNSINVGAQIYEKMISGMYLGEIARYAILDLIEKGQIFAQNPPADFFLDTASLSAMQSDSSPDLTGVEATLKKLNPKLQTTLEDRKLAKEVGWAVALRAAKLSAAGVVAVLGKIGALKNGSVAVDGSVFEHLPGFREAMDETIKELEPSSQVELVLTRDGSGIGAAIIAAIASSREGAISRSV